MIYRLPPPPARPIPFFSPSLSLLPSVSLFLSLSLFLFVFRTKAGTCPVSWHSMYGLPRLRCLLVMILGSSRAVVADTFATDGHLSLFSLCPTRLVLHQRACLRYSCSTFIFVNVATFTPECSLPLQSASMAVHGRSSSISDSGLLLQPGVLPFSVDSKLGLLAVNGPMVPNNVGFVLKPPWPPHPSLPPRLMNVHVAGPQNN